MKESVEIEMGATIVRAGVTIRPTFGGVDEVHQVPKGGGHSTGRRTAALVRLDLEYPDPVAPGGVAAAAPKQ